MQPALSIDAKPVVQSSGGYRGEIAGPGQIVARVQRAGARDEEIRKAQPEGDDVVPRSPGPEEAQPQLNAESAVPVLTGRSRSGFGQKDSGEQSQ
jgi:hypothetical protein